MNRSATSKRAACLAVTWALLSAPLGGLHAEPAAQATPEASTPDLGTENTVAPNPEPDDDAREAGAKPEPKAPEELGDYDPEMPSQPMTPGEPAFEEGTPVAMNPAAEAATKTYDVVVTRPLGFVSLLLGFTFFSISAPFVAATPGTDIPTSWDLFVLSRWDYTFVRPLGEL